MSVNLDIWNTKTDIFVDKVGDNNYQIAVTKFENVNTLHLDKFEMSILAMKIIQQIGVIEHE